MRKTDGQIKRLSDYLKDASRITLAEAEAMLDISESTARRLFIKIENMGQALRVHGGLQSLADSQIEYNYPRMESQCLAQKKLIAQAAAREIIGAKTIYLDSGSTVYQLSLCLAELLRAGRVDQIQVFTNSLKNLQALSGLTNIQFIGGNYREHRQDCCGYLAEETLQKLNFDLCALGADGCDALNGVSTTDMATARLCQIALEHSARHILLADSSKFQRSALAIYCQTEDFDTLITDAELNAETAQAVEAKGTRLVTVAP